MVFSKPNLLVIYMLDCFLSREGVIQLEIGFASAEKRASWELAFTDAKNKLCKLYGDRRIEWTGICSVGI